MMRAKISKFLISVVGITVAAAITTLFVGQEVRKFDFDKDGVTDTWRFYVKGKKIKEIIDDNYTIPQGKQRVILFWDQDGQLQKEISIVREKGSRTRKGVLYYKKGETVLYNGEPLLKQNVDPSGIMQSPLRKQGINVYVKDRSIRVLEHFDQGKNPHLRIFFEEGHISRTESDLRPFNYPDGKADEITYYKDGKGVRHEKDTDGDGKMDQITDLTTNPPTLLKSKEQGVSSTNSSAEK